MTNQEMETQLKNDIHKLMDKIRSKTNQIMLVVDLVNIDIEKKNLEELYKAFAGFQELNKNLKECFTNEYKDEN